MSTQSPARPRGVHLVGSIPLADAEAVFRTAGAQLGDRLHTLPDGETGKRLVWNSWTRGAYEATPGLEVVPPPPGSYTPWNRVRLVVDPGELRLNRLGFADAALASYATFARLKAEGAIPAHVRFQVCLPTTIAPMVILVEPDSRAGVEPAQRRQLLAELAEIVDRIPPDQLAIQWDVCQDVGIWEGVFEPWFDDARGGVIDRIATLSAAVPEGVAMGFHLCYGDFGHQHFVEPTDGTTLTEMANAICAAVQRPVDWIHVPVPIDRDDAAYFAPFASLALQPSTRLYLGLIHFGDGAEGAQRRIAAARAAVDGFGVATECGFGRRDPETIAPLMALHAEVADPLEVAR